MTAENLLSFYFNINIVLAIAAFAWIAARAVWSVTPLKCAFLPQLRLMYGVLLTVALTPILVPLGLGAIRQMGLAPNGAVPNVADFVVAQYLHGNIAMAPSRFESLLMLRSEFTHNVATLATQFGQAVAVVLITLTAIFALRLLRSVICVTRTIRNSYVIRRIGRIDIRLTDAATVPFSTRGLRRHYIVLPTSLLAHSNDVRIAIAHEMQHMRQGDLIWEILLEISRPIFFWNPAFGFWKREVEKLRELSCDQQVLKDKRMAVRDYCDCLLRVCRDSLRLDAGDQLRTPSVPFAQLDDSRTSSASAAFLKRRVSFMLSPTNGGGGNLLGMSFALVLFAAVVGGALMSQPTGDWTQDRLMLSTIVNLERLDIRNGAGQ